jgi:hypothetical protein
VGLGICLLAFLLALGFGPQTLPFSPTTPFSDSAISRYPEALYFQKSVREGGAWPFPLWNPHLMGGQPFAANPGSKVFYPLTYLLALPGWTPSLHVSAMLGLHLYWAGLGMYLWGRAKGLRLGPAGLAGLAYAFSPKLMAHGGVGHTDLLIAMAWLPWTHYALHHLAQTPRPRPWSPAVLGLGLAWGLMFIGAVQLALYTFGLSLIYALVLCWQKPSLGPGLIYAGLGALALAGVQVWLLGELAWRGELSRGQIGPAEAAADSLEPGRLLGLLLAEHGGYQETLTFVGLGVLVLALMGLLLRPRHNRLWWGLVILAVLYALGDQFILWPALSEVFPPLLWFRVPGRAWFWVAFLLPYLAAWGLQSLLDTPPDSARARLTIVGALGGGLSCSAGAFVLLDGTEVSQTALLGLFFLPLSLALVAWAIFQHPSPKVLSGAFLAVVLLDLLWVDRTLLEGRPMDEWLDPSPPALLAPLANSGARFYTPDYAIGQEDSAYWGIARFDGVDPFQMQAFIEAADPATGVPRQNYSVTVPAVVVLEDDPESQVYRQASLEAYQLGLWGVEWVVVGYELAPTPGLKLIEQREGLYFYQNEFAWGEDFRLRWEAGGRAVTIESSGSGRAMIPLTPSAGWDIPLDGGGLEAGERWEYGLSTPAWLAYGLHLLSFWAMLGGFAWQLWHKRKATQG